MQLIIEITQEQDAQLLLGLLERLKISYKTLNETPSVKQPAKSKRTSERFAGKLSEKTANALQTHITETRNSWERDI
jgi:hypothetical protein